MTTYETEITDRLQRAASLIHATPRLATITAEDGTALADRRRQDPSRSEAAHYAGDVFGDVFGDEISPLGFECEPSEHGDTGPHSARPGARHRLVAIAAVALLLLTGASLVARAETGPRDLQVAASDQALIEFDLSGPTPTVSELLPTVENPPLAFGEGRRAEREGQQRKGKWTSAAIALTTADGYEQPIVVSVLRGDAFYLSDAKPLRPDLQSQAFGELISFTDGRWTALATRTNPIVTVSGAVDPTTLLEVLDAMAPSESPPDSFVLDANQLPEGYAVIVEPTALGEDRTPRNVLADDFRGVSINEISDRINPLLAAALGGERLQTINIGTTIGWTGIYQDDEFGPLRSLVWSPEPGVVLEVSVVAERWDLDDTIALAASIEMVTPDQWNLRYPG